MFSQGRMSFLFRNCKACSLTMLCQCVELIVTCEYSKCFTLNECPSKQPAQGIYLETKQ